MANVAVGDSISTTCLKIFERLSTDARINVFGGEKGKGRGTRSTSGQGLTPQTPIDIFIDHDG